MLVNKYLSLAHPIPFHLCNGLVNVMLQNIFIRKKKNKGKNWTLEVRREFDSKGKEKEIYCQSEQFTRFNLPHYFIFERNTQAQKTVSFFQYLEISRLEIHHYVFLVSQPCFFPTGNHKDQQPEYLPIYCGRTQ